MVPMTSWSCSPSPPSLTGPRAHPLRQPPEFIARTVRDGLAIRGIRTLYIAPGSPWQYCYVESLNSRFRNECPNGEQLYTFSDALVVISDGIAIYKEERPRAAWAT